jgi:hypothetical protein
MRLMRPLLLGVQSNTAFSIYGADGTSPCQHPVCWQCAVDIAAGHGLVVTCAMLGVAGPGIRVVAADLGRAGCGWHLPFAADTFTMLAMSMVFFLDEPAGVLS